MDYKQKLNDLLLTTARQNASDLHLAVGKQFIRRLLIIAIFIISGSFIFVNTANAAIIAQQLDDATETNFNSEAGWYGSFTQKLSLNPNEFQGAFFPSPSRREAPHASHHKEQVAMEQRDGVEPPSGREMSGFRKEFNCFRSIP